MLCESVCPQAFLDLKEKKYNKDSTSKKQEEILYFQNKTTSK